MRFTSGWNASRLTSLSIALPAPFARARCCGTPRRDPDSCAVHARRQCANRAGELADRPRVRGPAPSRPSSQARNHAGSVRTVTRRSGLGAGTPNRSRGASSPTRITPDPDRGTARTGGWSDWGWASGRGTGHRVTSSGQGANGTGCRRGPKGRGTPGRTPRTPPPSGSPAPAAHPPRARCGRAGCARLNFVRLTLRIYHLQGPVTIRYAPHVFGVRHHPLQWVFRASEMSYRLRLAAAPADSAHGAGEEWARLEVTRTQRTAVRESVFSGPRVEGELMQHVEPMRFHRCFQDSASQA